MGFRSVPKYDERFTEICGPTNGDIVEAVGPTVKHDGVTFVPVDKEKCMATFEAYEDDDEDEDEDDDDDDDNDDGESPDERPRLYLPMTTQDGSITLFKHCGGASTAVVVSLQSFLFDESN